MMSVQQNRNWLRMKNKRRALHLQIKVKSNPLPYWNHFKTKKKKKKKREKWKIRWKDLSIGSAGVAMATLQVLPLLVVLLFFLFRFQTSQKTLFTFGLCSVQFFLMLQLFLERRRSTTSVRFCVINRRFFVNSAGLVSTDSIGTIATFLLHLISHSNHLGSNFSQDRPRILLDSRRLFGGGRGWAEWVKKVLFDWLWLPFLHW